MILKHLLINLETGNKARLKERRRAAWKNLGGTRYLLYLRFDGGLSYKPSAEHTRDHSETTGHKYLSLMIFPKTYSDEKDLSLLKISFFLS